MSEPAARSQSLTIDGMTLRDVQIGRADVDVRPGVSRFTLVEAVEATGFDVVPA